MTISRLFSFLATIYFIAPSLYGSSAPNVKSEVEARPTVGQLIQQSGGASASVAPLAAEYSGKAAGEFRLSRKALRATGIRDLYIENEGSVIAEDSDKDCGEHVSGDYEYKGAAELNYLKPERIIYWNGKNLGYLQYKTNMTVSKRNGYDVIEYEDEGSRIVTYVDSKAYDVWPIHGAEGYVIVPRNGTVSK